MNRHILYPVEELVPLGLFDDDSSADNERVVNLCSNFLTSSRNVNIFQENLQVIKEDMKEESFLRVKQNSITKLV